MAGGEHRVVRWLRLLSSLLLVACVGLWIRGQFRTDEAHRLVGAGTAADVDWYVRSCSRGIVCYHILGLGPLPSVGWVYESDVASDQGTGAWPRIASIAGFIAPFPTSAPTVANAVIPAFAPAQTVYFVPYWCMAIAFAALPTIWLVRGWRGRPEG